MKSQNSMVFNFRVERIRGTAEEFARTLLLTLLAADTIPDPEYRVVRDIYEDDGRGNIRDYIYASYSAANFKIEIILERASRAVVNFRFSGNGISCEQKPSLPGMPLQLVGENSNWYWLKAPSPDAERILCTIVTEELCSLTGLKTEADPRLSERRVQYILAGRDPDLVLNEFHSIEYRLGRAEAFKHLQASMLDFPEFSAGIGRLIALLKKQRP